MAQLLSFQTDFRLPPGDYGSVVNGQLSINRTDVMGGTKGVMMKMLIGECEGVSVGDLELTICICWLIISSSSSPPSSLTHTRTHTCIHKVSRKRVVNVMR